MRKATAIHAQGLETALQLLAKERDFQVVYRSEVVGDLRTDGAVGELTFDEALTQLLSGTGLTYRYLDEKAITILPLPSGSSSSTRPGKESVSAPMDTEAAPGFWDRLRLAQAEANSSAPAEASSAKLEEIVVTAQKRAERLIDTPQSVSVLSSDMLARIGAVQFRDFANTVPGLTFTTIGAGYNQITLRGVTAGFDIGQTVGIYVDDVPYGTSGGFANGAQVTLDVGLFDIDRIEVLRGPQGTLYGASTMGGLIKYVGKRPDLARFGVDIQTGISGTQRGGVNYNGAVAVNAPIVADRIAVRASSYYSRDGGYIDNLALGQNDVNQADVYGGRLDLLFAPTDALTIRVGGFLQNIARDGQATSDNTLAGVPEDGNLEQRRLFAEPFDQRFRLVSGTVTYDLGPASLTSISSYQTMHTQMLIDISRQFVPILESVDLFYSAVGIPQSLSTDKFTQEMRFASSEGRTLEWLVGGFYTHETSGNEQDFLLLDPAGQPALNDLYVFSSPSSYREVAGFANLTYHFTSKLDVSGGLRYARNRQAFSQTGSGAFGITTPVRRSTENVSTYLANARYRFSGHTTGYVRYATGYRPGGPNFVSNDPTTGLPVGPPTFEADRLKSYEGGFKSETADRRFGIDLAGYYIDWSNIQIITSRGGFSGIANAAGGANVTGAELTLSARPAHAYTMTGAFAYQDARLSQTDTELGGAKGDRLPNVPRFTAALSADYEFPIDRLRPTVGATLRYASDRTSGFEKGRSPQYHLPSYTVVDLRTGLELGVADFQLYVHNLFDRRGELSADTSRGPAQLAILQPRTVGVSLSAHF
jgi:outer membrane receptor protein involved in Fe transport